MFNNVIMMGRIASDLELKSTPSGVSVCTFRIAVERRYQAKGEERKADFFNIVAWRNAAEFVCKWFAKGKMVHIQGELQTRTYTDKNGNPATWYEIIADRIDFTGEKNSNNSANAPATPPEPPQYGPASGGEIPPDPGPNDDYPF